MNIYNILISNPNHEINKHYLNRYIKFIKFCLKSNQNLPEDIPIENHHICPKKLFLKYKSFYENPWNKISLTLRQHYIAHWLLYKTYPENDKMCVAFFLMNNKQNTRIYGRVYEKLRMKFNKHNTGKNHPNYLNREIILMTPEGIVVENQDECWELIHKNKLRTGTLYKIAKGYPRHHKEFQCRFKDEFFDFIPIDKLIPKYIAMFLDGTIEKNIINVEEFSRKHNVASRSLLQCANKNPHHKHANGIQFRYANPDNFFDFLDLNELQIHKKHTNRNAIHKFQNKITEDIFIGTQSEFIKKYGLNSGNVSLLISGDYISVKNWIYLNLSK